jgi:ankyrin repeat protein
MALTDHAGLSALHVAVRRAVDTDIVRLLLAAGARANAMSRNGCTPLLIAAQRVRNRPTASLFCVRLSVCCEMRCTATQCAMHHTQIARLHTVQRRMRGAICGMQGQAALVEMLLANKASPNMRCSRNGESALHCAVRINSLPTVNALLSGGARLDVRYARSD